METRKCKTCHETKPIQEFEFRDYKGNRRKECRPCRKASRRISEAPRREPLREIPEHERVSIINAFALWFGPVDRRRALAWAP